MSARILGVDLELMDPARVDIIGTVGTTAMFQVLVMVRDTGDEVCFAVTELMQAVDSLHCLAGHPPRSHRCNQRPAPHSQAARWNRRRGQPIDQQQQLDSRKSPVSHKNQALPPSFPSFYLFDYIDKEQYATAATQSAHLHRNIADHHCSGLYTAQEIARRKP